MNSFPKALLFLAFTALSVGPVAAQTARTIFNCTLIVTQVNSPIEVEVSIAQKLGRPMTSVMNLAGARYYNSGEYKPEGLYFIAESNVKSAWKTTFVSWNILKGRAGRLYIGPKDPNGSGAVAAYQCTPIGAQG
jgi:hypothetical protein